MADRVTVKSVVLDGIPHSFDAGDFKQLKVRKRAVWTVMFRGRERRIVTTLDRGIQEKYHEQV